MLVAVYVHTRDGTNSHKNELNQIITHRELNQLNSF